MRNLFIAFILVITVYSCTEEYDLHLKSTQPIMVVDGTITNQDGPYLIRLTKSRTNMYYEQNRNSINDTSFNYRSPFDGAEAIKDAEVFITDKNISFTDTLIKCP